MGTTVNSKTYINMINEDIEELEKYMPEHSLEKEHIKQVLKVGCFLHSFIYKKAWELYKNTTNF